MSNKLTLGQDVFIRRMEQGEVVNSFDCGDEDLNDFILNSAPLYLDERLAVSYVLANVNEPAKTLGYCALMNDRLCIDDFPSNTDFNRFRKNSGFPNPKRITSYPAVKIGRLAVDKTMAGKRAGTQIINFVKSYFLEQNKAGCRFITVDAYINAVDFYKRNGFKEIEISEDKRSKHTRPMFFDLETMKK